MEFKSRIAPTPSGYLHIGNALSFLTTWLWTKMNDGKLLLRIDDMDEQRCKPAYITNIFECLDYLEIRYDEGPNNTQELTDVFSQMKRIDMYENALQQLAATQHVYACICSRKEMMEMPLGPVCPRDCRHHGISLDTPNAAWRIKMNADTYIDFTDRLLGNIEVPLHKAMPDFIVKQKNGLPAYQLCSLMDDVHFGITHIVRGKDLLVSTAAQLYLADLLGAKNFGKIQFLHHPLITNQFGEKLSKSAGDISINEMLLRSIDKTEVYRKILEHTNFKSAHISSLEGLLHLMDGKEIEDLFI